MQGKDLLHAMAQRLGIEAEALLRRYYGSPGDARLELEEVERTGRLQESLARVLRLELERTEVAAE
jgi:predicted phosphoribosyltransferase